MKTKELYLLALNKMKEAGRIAPAFDLSCLFDLHFGFDRGGIILNGDVELNLEKCEALLNDAQRVCDGYPLQYIIGRWEFMGLEFYVGEGVLIPRADTETLVQAAMEAYNEMGKAGFYMADLCSGSGAVAISAAKLIKNARVEAFELSDKALEYLNCNNQLHGNAVEAVKADVLQSPNSGVQYDCITANPPYITSQDMERLSPEVKKEPHMALHGGQDGLVFYRGITGKWNDSIRSGGCILFEIGMGQHDDVAAILRDNGFRDVFFKKDLSGIIRVVGGYKK